MQDTEVTNRYKANGLVTEHGRDKPGKIYPPHRHEKTYLFTLTGSISVRLDEGNWQTLRPGTEFIVGSGQLHEAKVGNEGWKYIAAWDTEEAKLYPNAH